MKSVLLVLLCLLINVSVHASACEVNPKEPTENYYCVGTDTMNKKLSLSAVVSQSTGCIDIKNTFFAQFDNPIKGIRTAPTLDGKEIMMSIDENDGDFYQATNYMQVTYHSKSASAIVTNLTLKTVTTLLCHIEEGG